MKLKIFTVYDHAAKAYILPFFLPNEEMAVRTFQDCCNDTTHQFGKHPEDYTLFQIGEYDDSDSSISMLNPKEPIGVGTEFVLNKIEKGDE